MKNLMLALLLALAPLAYVAGIAGCTTSQKAVAYKTLGAIAATVDTLLKPYADLVVAGKVDAATQIRIGELKTKYSVAFNAAVTVARGDLTKLAPEDVQNLANTLTEALTVILKKGGAQ